jgi:hypothetical protein
MSHEAMRFVLLGTLLAGFLAFINLSRLAKAYERSRNKEGTRFRATVLGFGPRAEGFDAYASAQLSKLNRWAPLLAALAAGSLALFLFMPNRLTMVLAVATCVGVIGRISLTRIQVLALLRAVSATKA